MSENAARIANLKSRLVNALDRQGRAQTNDEWFADEKAVAEALKALEGAGQDRGEMLDYAQSQVEAMNRRAFD